MDNPWRENYFQFLEANAGATFHHATTNDRIQIFYCLTKEKGMWLLPGSGMGPLQAGGLQIMKKIFGQAEKRLPRSIWRCRCRAGAQPAILGAASGAHALQFLPSRKSFGQDPGSAIKARLLAAEELSK